MANLDRMYSEPFACRDLPDGRSAQVWVRMFNTIITIGRKGALSYDDSW